MAVKPLVLAMLACTDATLDQPIETYTVRGVKWGHICHGLPAKISPLKVYLAMTGIRGPTKLGLRWSNSDRSQGYVSPFEISAPSPIDVQEGVVDVSGMPVTQAGEWFLDLLWNGEILTSCRIYVIVAP